MSRSRELDDAALEAAEFLDRIGEPRRARSIRRLIRRNRDQRCAIRTYRLENIRLRFGGANRGTPA